MPPIVPPKPITAFVYGNGWPIDNLMRKVTDHLARAGFGLAGFVQINQPRVGRTRCDMLLQDLASGEEIRISQDRGAHARGCMLDVDELLRAGALALQALEHAPALLVINKFGKTECEGGGFRALIAEAIARNVPVLIAVPQGNLDDWWTFSSGHATDHVAETLPADAGEICRLIGLTADVRQTVLAQ